MRWVARPTLTAVVVTAVALVGALVWGADGSVRPDGAAWRPPVPPRPATPTETPAEMPAGVPAAGFVFPIVGPSTLTDSFGDPRPGGRSHEGVDILADKLEPVVAVADGTVRWVMNERGGRCCSLEIRHPDGWRTRYIHLNNDSPGTDDGRVVGVVPGLERGSEVHAGEVVGWVGDSGNAENTVPHLHFELIPPRGRAIDPYPLLEILQRRAGSAVHDAP